MSGRDTTATGRIVQQFRSHPYAWMLALALFYFVWSSLQLGHNLTKVCRVAGPDLLSYTQRTSDQQQALTICLQHKD